MAANLEISSNRFRLSSIDTLRFGSERVSASKLDRELYARVHKAVQSALVENAQFQRELACAKTREFEFHWNGQTLSYRIGDGDWKQIPSDQKIMPLFCSGVREAHDLYTDKASSLRKVQLIDWEAPELQNSVRRIEKVKQHVQGGRNLDGTEECRSITRSVARRTIEHFPSAFDCKKHICNSILGNNANSVALVLSYVAVPVDFLAGYLVEKNGKKMLDEAVKFEDTEGIRDGKVLYYQGKLLKYGSVVLGASLATQLVADKLLTGVVASQALVLGTVLGMGGLIAVLGYALGSAGYVGYNAFRCMKFRRSLNQQLNHPGEEHEKLRAALEYLQGLLIPEDEDVLRIIEKVKNDKSIPLDKEEEVIEKKIENLFISRVQYLIRRCGTRSVRQIIEKAPGLIEKLQSEDRQVRKKAIEESKKLISTVKKENLQKTILYTILFIAALLGIIALLITFAHGAILATFILGAISAGLASGVGVYVLGQYLWFIYQRRKEGKSETAENIPPGKMPVESPGISGSAVAVVS